MSNLLLLLRFLATWCSLVRFWFDVEILFLLLENSLSFINSSKKLVSSSAAPWLFVAAAAATPPHPTAAAVLAKFGNC